MFDNNRGQNESNQLNHPMRNTGLNKIQFKQRGKLFTELVMIF